LDWRALEKISLPLYWYNLILVFFITLSLSLISGIFSYHKDFSIQSLTLVIKRGCR